MVPEQVYASRYEQRVRLVQDLLKADTPLTVEQSRALAMKLLRTLDRIPEKVR